MTTKPIFKTDQKSLTPFILMTSVDFHLPDIQKSKPNPNPFIMKIRVIGGLKKRKTNPFKNQA